MKKVFLMLTIVAFSSVVVNAQSHVGHHATTTQKAKTSSTHAMLGVQGNCDMCKARIEKAALGVKGVSSAMWEAKDQKLHVNYNASVANLSAISKAIAKVGHDTEKDKAIPEVYKALPGCCKYKK